MDRKDQRRIQDAQRKTDSEAKRRRKEYAQQRLAGVRREEAQDGNVVQGSY
jgi:hypothetical protein